MPSYKHFLLFLLLDCVTDYASATDEPPGLQLLCPRRSTDGSDVPRRRSGKRKKLCHLLETEQVGTPVLNVLLLSQRVAGCHAEITSASFDDLTQWLQEGVPPLVFVSTAPSLPADGVSACPGGGSS